MAMELEEHSTRYIWFLLAAGAFSLAATIENPVYSVLGALVGMVVTVMGITGQVRFPTNGRVAAAGTILVVTAIGVSEIMGRFALLDGTNYLWVSGAFVLAMSILMAPRVRPGILRLLPALFFVIISATILVPDFQPSLSSDVYRAHAAAGDAILSGQNPYSSAVSFESGDPHRPAGTVIEGYPYPLPVLATYGVMAAFTDPRIVSVIAMGLIVVGLSLLPVLGERSKAVVVGVAAIISTLPIWRFALFMAWTEPLTAALAGLSVWGIARRRRWAWVVAGVALASKQYMLFLAPLVLLHKDEDERREGWVALGVAAFIAALPAVLGPAEYFRSIVGNALAIGTRPDSQSLTGALNSLGADFLVPTLVVVPVVALVVFWLYKRQVPNHLLVAGATVTLAAGLLVTSAFPNYWMLVAVLAGLAAVTTMRNETSRRVGPNELSTQHQ